jgi:hypothetical protein
MESDEQRDEHNVNRLWFNVPEAQRLRSSVVFCVRPLEEIGAALFRLRFERVR